MAAGAVVLTGGIAVIAVAVPFAVMWGFELNDARNETKRIGLKIRKLLELDDYSGSAFSKR